MENEKLLKKNYVKTEEFELTQYCIKEAYRLKFDLFKKNDGKEVAICSLQDEKYFLKNRNPEIIDIMEIICNSKDHSEILKEGYEAISSYISIEGKSLNYLEAFLMNKTIEGLFNEKDQKKRKKLIDFIFENTKRKCLDEFEK